jgi:hypothetical protein
MPPRCPRLIAAALLIICVIWPFSAPVEAQSKKGKTSVSRGKSRKQVSSSRSRSARRSRGKRGRYYASRRSARTARVFYTPAKYTVVPDQIEVLEPGSSSSELARHLNPPAPPTQSAQASQPTVAPRRKRVRIESSRALQIQQALASRGFYSGEMTGVYDEATVEAMRRFQASEKISATGYPTAHALKRLGLTNW